jgi:hypothetical protein
MIADGIDPLSAPGPEVAGASSLLAVIAVIDIWLEY